MTGKIKRYGRDPPCHDGKVFGERVGEHDDPENKHPERQIGDLPIGHIPDFAFTFLDQPAGAKKSVAETKADTAQQRKGTEPSEVAAAVAAIGDWKALHQRSDSQALHEGGEKRTAGKADVPQPAHPFRLGAVLEGNSAQNEAREHH